MNLLDQTLSQLAREIPGATAVFHRHQLDFCCGGKRTLFEAAAKRELNAQTITDELAALATEGSANEEDWATASEAELIEHILTRYHDLHRQQLPELIRLATRVELVHGGHPACPSGLTAHLERMKVDLEEHMRKEEQILFPMIARGMQRAAVHPMSIMRDNHVEHGEGLERIRQLTANITPPEGACNTWRALYLGLSSLVTDVMDHIHLENNILFQRIEDRVGEVQHG